MLVDSPIYVDKGLEVHPVTPQAFTTTWRGGNTADPSYHAAEVNCLNKDWQPANISCNAAISESWEVMTGRIRDLIRNDPVLTKALNMMVNLCIGSGIASYSEATQDSQGTYFDEFAIESDELWERWSNEEADISGRLTFVDMQRLSFKELAQTGCSVWLEVIDSDPSRTSPLAYQLLEYEQLDRTRDRPSAPGRNQIVNGIELNRFGKTVAAYIYDAHPYDARAVSPLVGFRSTRIPSKRLILNYIPDRISSHMGVTWFSSLIQVTRDLDRMLANELTSRAVSALMTLFVKKENPGTVIGDALNAESKDRPGVSSVRMGYPAIVEIARDDDIAVAESKGGSRDADIFVDLLLNQVAMGSGLSMNRLKGDASEANLASILSGHRDDERMIGPVQKHQEFKIVRPIRIRHDEIAAAMGDYSGVGVSADFYLKNKRRLQKLRVIPTGDPDIQPKDEGEAAIDRMRSGRTTPQYEAGRLGMDWRANLRAWAQFNDTLERLGLGWPDLTKGAGGVFLPFVPPTKQPAFLNQKQEAGSATPD